MHLWHFAARDATKDAYSAEFATPRDGELLFQCDFKEHDTLPRGLVEAGSWWHAGSRRGVTILTLLVRSKKLPSTYFTFCSKTMEQSSLFVIACMMGIFDRFPGLSNTTHCECIRTLVLISAPLASWPGSSCTHSTRCPCAVFRRPCGIGSIASLARRSSAPSMPTPNASTRWRRMRENTTQLHRSGNSSTSRRPPKSDIPSKFFDTVSLRKASMVY